MECDRLSGAKRKEARQRLPWVASLGVRGCLLVPLHTVHHQSEKRIQVINCYTLIIGRRFEYLVICVYFMTMRSPLRCANATFLAHPRGLRIANYGRRLRAGSDDRADGRAEIRRHGGRICDFRAFE